MPRGEYQRYVKDIRGQVFGAWTVLSYVGSRRYGGKNHHYWRCRCRCGRIGEVSSRDLKRGRSTQCTKCRDTKVQQLAMEHAHKKSQQSKATQKALALLRSEWEKDL